MQDSTIHIVAPSFFPGKVGGAEIFFRELIREFMETKKSIRIHLNPEAAEHFPEWKSSIQIVNTGSMKDWKKSFSVLRLQLFGSSTLPTDRAWFPFGAMFPLHFKGRSFVTIHDTLEKDFPDSVPWNDRWFRKVNRPTTLRKSQIITSSRFGAERLEKHYGVKARVVPPGIPRLEPPSYARVPTKPFVFYPANAWAHKNHQFLLDLWRNFEVLRKFSLVFTMSTGCSLLKPQIERMLRENIDVQILGHVTRAELLGLYERAHCTVFPSRYEGFGLPVHESLMCRCPILVNDRTALAETTPSDYPFKLKLEPELWRDAILNNPREVLKNPELYLSHRSWSDAAQEYWNIFQQPA
jgi:glycosyltransferase involved in cell wall biosynthesis